MCKGGCVMEIPLYNPNTMPEILKKIEEEWKQQRVKTTPEISKSLYQLKDFISALDQSLLISVMDENGVITDVNTLFSEVSGYPRSKIIGTYHHFLKSDYHPGSFFEKMWDTIKKGHVWEGEIKNQHKEGDTYWLKTSIFPFFNEGGNVYRSIAVMKDVTEEKQQEAKKRESVQDDYYEILNHMDSLVFKVRQREETFVYSFFAGKLKRRFSVKPEKLYGKTAFEIFSEEEAYILESYYREAFSGENCSFEINLFHTYFYISLSPIYQNGRVKEIVGTAIDIDEKKQTEQQVHHMTYHTVLTGLPNRQKLLDDLTCHITKEEPFQLIMIDLDQFKQINDSSGHKVGDDVLKQAAKRLQRKQFPVYHLGADEFALITFQPNDVVDSLFESFKEPFISEEIAYYVTISVGVSHYPVHGKSSLEMLKNVDTALYTAKEKGRNLCCVYEDQMNEHITEKIYMTNNIRKALSNDEFELYYQPQVCLKTNKIVGVEALIRWNHPEEGIISPGKFIPIAENSGLIIPIGEMVLEKALTQLQLWRKQGYSQLRMSVNIAAEHFNQSHFANTVQTMLENARVPAKQLELELTENSLLKNTGLTTNTLHTLRRMGVHLSIDDFGIGYSSLSYLRHFPLTTLKIDKSFMNHINEKEKDRALISSIIHLAGSLGMRVIAEGVETKETFQFLQQEKCDEMQGFYFSKPMPAADIEKLLKNYYF
ncbi:EAL domain-containing protein [Salibacterium salarium]|uniref:EAL domain-containing protein n=2 Tax=Salibacterium salarium TaxID=284579 RepID=A0A3R9RCC7_9BACI|nr:EAL domain-containing protein [Salibacterium salarium]